MPLNRRFARQDSVAMLSPFSKQNCGIESDIVLRPKQFVQRAGIQRRKRSLLGNDLDGNMYKHADTDNSCPIDKSVDTSSDSLYDSPITLHSAKTGYMSQIKNVDPTMCYTPLGVRPVTVDTRKFGDVGHRQNMLLNGSDAARPTTVDGSLDRARAADVRVNRNGGMYGLWTYALTKLKKPEQGIAILNPEKKDEMINKEPLPPIQHSLTHDYIVIDKSIDVTDENNSKILDKCHAESAMRDTSPKSNETIGVAIEPSSSSEIQKVADFDDKLSSDTEPTPDANVTPPTGYRSVTPLSLCDVMSDVDKKTEDSEVNRPPLCISDSEEFDTDLETDQNFGKVEPAFEDVNICRYVYREECRRLQVPPQKHIQRGLAQRTLSLRNRSLGPKAIPPLCQALKDNLRVERLNLDGTDVTDAGVQHIAEMLIENITISHLNLANNTLGLRASQVLSHVMIITENLTHLNLTGNKFDDRSAWYLSAGIGSNTSITHLDLSYNDFGEQGGVLLGTGLARNTKLLVLNLTWNKVCGKGSVAIFQALMVNNVLEVLNISWNGLGYDGAVALSKCLKVNKSVVDIDVSNNRLDWRTGFLLAEGLTMNHTVQKLRVGHNPLTTTGCMDILEAVAAPDSTINLLDCSGVTVVGEAELLAATISRRRKFQFLHGGIVTTHDKVGEKQDREVDPMLRIIEYLRMLGLRPLELMKSFDKSSSAFELPRKEFIEQIKKIGVKLQPFEIDALANSVSGKGYNKNVINYRKLSLAVREVVQAERERKMREREEYMQIKNYHETILRKGQLDYSHTNSIIADKDTLKAGGMQAGSSVFGTSIESASSIARISPIHSKVQLSMCSPLESSRSIISSPKKWKKRIKKKKNIRA